MIRFFRRLRENLLVQNKVRKYLAYALGEIILVVIGILIALQINNWNESRKEQRLLEASLTSLRMNLNEDIGNFQQQLAHNKIVLQAIDFTFRLISIPEYSRLDPRQIADSTFHIASERDFQPTSTAFKSMESGAHFRWIADQALTESIYRYYGMIENIHAKTENNNHFVQNQVESFTYREMEFSSFIRGTNPYAIGQPDRINSIQVIRESVVLENLLIGRKFRCESEIESCQKAIELAEELIFQIESYLAGTGRDIPKSSQNSSK